MSRARSLLANAALAAASLLVGALLIEGAARLWVHASLAQARRLAPPLPLSRYHEVLGWDKTPGAAQTVRRPEFEISLQFNSKGLRGPERDYTTPPGTHRVLILGDSFAEGYYVDESQTVRAVLEDLLDREGCGRWEVINGGTIAYSTDQEYLFYKTEGHRYGAESVVLLFYYNDLYYNASEVGPGGEPKPYFDLEGDALVPRNSPVPSPTKGLLNRQEPGVPAPKPWHGSIALRLLSNRTVDASPRLHGLLARLGLVEPVSAEPPKEYWPFGRDHAREVNDMWKRTRRILAALKADVEAHGGRLAVLYVPVRFEVNDAVWELSRQRYHMGRRWDRDVVFERLRAVCEELAIPLVDPRSELRRQEATTAPAYYTRDVHWTASGNAVAARALATLVRSWLPCRG
ncbi:MAG TPA: SGNH/GDSL hydrolase family protein [Vicinamibacteria bacterium]